MEPRAALRPTPGWPFWPRERDRLRHNRVGPEGAWFGHLPRQDDPANRVVRAWADGRVHALARVSIDLHGFAPGKEAQIVVHNASPLCEPWLAHVPGKSMAILNIAFGVLPAKLPRAGRSGQAVFASVLAGLLKPLETLGEIDLDPLL